MVKEIEADAKTFADARRTLIQAEKKAVAEVKVVDEPVTVVVSQKGLGARAQGGHGHEAASFAFKAGDALYGTFECRTVDTLLAFGSNGRVYSVPVALLPGARGDGQPVTTLIELESGTQLLHYFAGPAAPRCCCPAPAATAFPGHGGEHGLAPEGGKAFITWARAKPCARLRTLRAAAAVVSRCLPPRMWPVRPGGRILTFEISELKTMANGGRGLMLIDLEPKDTAGGAAAYTRSIRIEGVGRGGKLREETLEIRSLNNARAARGRKGKAADLGFKPRLPDGAPDCPGVPGLLHLR
jgi:topoisomerase-4 subunit A